MMNYKVMTEFNKSVKFMLKWSKNLHNSKIMATFVYQKKDREVEVKF